MMYPIDYIGIRTPRLRKLLGINNISSANDFLRQAMTASQPSAAAIRRAAAGHRRLRTTVPVTASLALMLMRPFRRA